MALCVYDEGRKLHSIVRQPAQLAHHAVHSKTREYVERDCQSLAITRVLSSPENRLDTSTDRLHIQEDLPWPAQLNVWRMIRKENAAYRDKRHFTRNDEHPLRGRRYPLTTAGVQRSELSIHCKASSVSKIYRMLLIGQMEQGLDHLKSARVSSARDKVRESQDDVLERGRVVCITSIH